MGNAEEYLRSKSAEFGGRALIVGKGPSFNELDLDEFKDCFIVGLNETPACIRCHAGFIIDEEILESSVGELLANIEEVIIVPRVMHRKRVNVGKLTFYGPAPHSAEGAGWRREAQGRLRVFNLATAESDPNLGDTYPAYNFSAPTLASLLAANGFRHINLAGIDGGTHYAADFESLEYKKLKSVQNSFDAQFADFRSVQRRWNVKFSSIRCSKPTMLIGADNEQLLAQEVLKWSIDTNTFLKVEYCSPSSESRALYANGAVGTPFSLQRLFLPRFAHHEGRGAYFDSDMLVFKDIYELFNVPMDNNVLVSCAPSPGRPQQYSVFVVDCKRARWDPDRLLSDYQAGNISYDALMKEFSFAEPKAATLPWFWNSLEIFEPHLTANIHFTDMGTQPWLSVYNPNAAVWCEALFKALEERPSVMDALKKSLDNDWIRPSLKWQIEHGQADPWGLPSVVRKMDKEWLPPHMKARDFGTSRRMQVLRWRLASRIRRIMQSRSYVRLMKLRHALRKII